MRDQRRIKRLGFGVGRAMCVAALQTLGVALIALINPFHIDEWAEQRSEAVWQRVFADTYGCRATVSAEAPRPCEGHFPDPWVRVVYLDETGPSAAAGPQATRLSSLDDQADILRDLAKSSTPNGEPPKPKAIFIDILFQDAAPYLKDWTFVTPKGANRDALTADVTARVADCSRGAAPKTPTDHFACYVARVAEITHYGDWGFKDDCTNTALAKLACIQKFGGVPVIFATSDNLDALRAQKALAPTPAMEALDRVALTAPSFLAGRGYALAAEGRAIPQSPLPPVSLLYAAYCDHNDSNHCPKPPVQYGPGEAVWNRRDFGHPLKVEWGVGDEENSDFAKMMTRWHPQARCRSAQTSIGFGPLHVPTPMVRVFQEMAPALFGDQTSLEGKDAPCQYVPSLPYADLDRASPEDKDLILSGKIVLVGGQFQSLGDWIATPTGEAPGVFYHAMALTNLIEHGKDYAKAGPPVLPGSALDATSLPTFFGVFLIFLMGILAVMAMNEPALDPALLASRSARRRGLLWARRIGVALAPFIIALSALAVFGRRLDHVNAVVLLAPLTAIAPKLVFVSLRPLLERGFAPLSFLDVADARLLGSDLPLQAPPAEAIPNPRPPSRRNP